MILSYKKRKLFKFKRIYKGYELVLYRRPDDPTVTELVIPKFYWFRPVISIKTGCFKKCKYLRKVYIPDSVISIEYDAFIKCDELSEIRLPPGGSLESTTFIQCPRLDPQTVLLGCIGEKGRSCHWPLSRYNTLEWDELLRPDVFALTIKYDSFRLVGTKELYEELIRRRLVSHFEMLEQEGRSPSAEETDALIRFCVENKMTEMTAYFLDYKNRKFGFAGFGDDDDFEL